MKHQYVLPIEVEWQPEGIYYAECPLIPGCHVEAETLPEVFEYIEDAARNLLEFRREHGLPLPEGLKGLDEHAVLHAEIPVTLES